MHVISINKNVVNLMQESLLAKPVDRIAAMSENCKIKNSDMFNLSNFFGFEQFIHYK
jgi:hypothetical protein